jgi:hypothetical protein
LETSTLDGEKHLKPRHCPPETLRCLDHSKLDPEFSKKARIILEDANKRQNKLTGLLSFNLKDLEVPIDIKATF